MLIFSSVYSPLPWAMIKMHDLRKPSTHRFLQTSSEPFPKLRAGRGGSGKYREKVDRVGALLGRLTVFTRTGKKKKQG